MVLAGLSAASIAEVSFVAVLTRLTAAVRDPLPSTCTMVGRTETSGNGNQLHREVCEMDPPIMTLTASRAALAVDASSYVAVGHRTLGGSRD
jgi:hypothetical protein